MRRSERGARLRASMPTGTGSAPWLLSIVACVAVMVVASLVLRVLGAGDSTGWLIVAVGLVNPTITVTDRWWTTRPSAPV